MCDNKDYFEKYLNEFVDSPSLVIVRSVELKNFPKDLIKEPILDLCCGDGFFIQQLNLNFREIYGCDVDNNALEKAKIKNVYKEVHFCDARDLSLYLDDTFQTIISNCALEHVEDIDSSLSNISRILSKGGYLIMTVPSKNLNNWFLPKLIFSKINKYYGEKLLEKYNRIQKHINIYSKEEWEKKLQCAGLRILSYYYLFREEEYKFITLLDAFWIIPLLGKIYKIFSMIFPFKFKKIIWRKFLKQIYINSQPLKFGGELVIIAEKI